MITVLGKVTLEDLPKFVGVFSTRGREMRTKHGCLGSRVYKSLDEENRAVVLLDWESHEAFEAFVNDPQVRETMQSSGTVGRPEFTLLEFVGEFPG